jgi:hypothetical protein
VGSKWVIRGRWASEARDSSACRFAFPAVALDAERKDDVSGFRASLFFKYTPIKTNPSTGHIADERVKLNVVDVEAGSANFGARNSSPQ